MVGLFRRFYLPNMVDDTLNIEEI